MYYAIIGDIINSKKIEDRYAAQVQLNSALKNINHLFKEDIASDFIITLGDEFQGVLHNAMNVMEITDRIKFQMDPIQLRFGIGIGDISTPINRRASLGSDGPAYWYAREAINLINGRKNRIIIQTGSQIGTINLINSSLSACDFIEDNWTSGQRDFVRRVILENGFTKSIKQTELAAKFGKTPQAINYRMKETGIQIYIQLKETISQTLQDGWGKDK
ncbi:SatD family protein [bacterium]|nr:SatD family protein [bacterium]